MPDRKKRLAPGLSKEKAAGIRGELEDLSSGQPPEAEIFQVKRGLQKIRRRWIMSLAGVALSLMFLVLPWGQAQAAASASPIWMTSGAAGAISISIWDGDYEKAWSYLSMEAMYQGQCSTEKLIRLPDYHAVEIGGETWYLTKDVCHGACQIYLETGDESAWGTLLSENQHGHPTLVPTDRFPEAAWYEEAGVPDFRLLEHGQAPREDP